MRLGLCTMSFMTQKVLCSHSRTITQWDKWKEGWAHCQIDRIGEFSCPHIVRKSWRSFVKVSCGKKIVDQVTQGWEWKFYAILQDFYSQIGVILTISSILALYNGKTAIIHRDVSTGATGATAVASKFSDTLTLSPLWGADSAHHRRGCNQIFPVVMSLRYILHKLRL